MNRSLLWRILLASAALHAVVFLLFYAWPTGLSSPTSRPDSTPTFTSTVDGFQMTTSVAAVEIPAVAPNTESLPLPDSLQPMNKEVSETMRTRLAAMNTAANATSPTLESGTNRHTVVFILDKSGSMYETVGGTRRIDFAIRELRTLITGLDRKTKFNIVLFAEKVIVFQPEATFASAEHKLDAIRFLQRDDPCGGSTDFPAGYQAALAQKGDTLLLLSDGEFNSSEQQLFTSARSLRTKYGSESVLNVLAFFPRPNTNAEKVLTRLSADTHGELQFWKAGVSSRFALMK